MCGRFGLFSDLDRLAEQFGFDPLTVRDMFAPSYNVAPTNTVLTLTAPGLVLEPQMMRWGLIAPWQRRGDPLGKPVFNARSETVAEKPMFRRAFASGRGLVLADGFYEWQRRGGVKQPYWICRRDGLPFAFAAIWSLHGGAGLHSCAVLTTGPNELMTPIHSRMPVILAADDSGIWLDPEAPPERLLEVCRSSPWPGGYAGNPGIDPGGSGEQQ
ncbi:MAG: SOS response-associated peptidase [Chloroflexi bacterium]|nr:SOS response-associated peptidase [Chloroflexota bacterium]